MNFDLTKIVRPNILHLEPYSCARNDFSGDNAEVFLDANENPYNKPLNRYPDPLQRKVKDALSRIKGVSPENIFLGNGSDEAIDLAYRCFCRPGIDNVVAIDPTYGMYKTCADVNDIEYRKALLNNDFQINADKLLSLCDKNTKLIWICSPNNPTGNSLNHDEIKKILLSFNGIVIIDEAYGDFSSLRQFRNDLAIYPNMIVLNTMSKMWGCAAIRLGMAFADKEIINLYNKVKYPYNINKLTQQQALDILSDPYETDKWKKTILLERDRVMSAFSELPICERIYPTDANFFLAKTTDADGIYKYLINSGIIVRNRNRVSLCQNCLRITIGSKVENNELLAALRNLR